MPLVPFTIVTWVPDQEKFKVLEPTLECYALGPNLIETHIALLKRFMEDENPKIETDIPSETNNTP